MGSSGFRRLTSGAIALALVTGIGWPGAAQQPCNPVIDGTYCATAGIRSSDAASSGSSRRDLGLGQSLSGVGLYERPATLGAVTWSSQGRCIGLVRRVNCKD